MLLHLVCHTTGSIDGSTARARLLRRLLVEQADHIVMVVCRPERRRQIAARHGARRQHARAETRWLWQVAVTGLLLERGWVRLLRGGGWDDDLRVTVDDVVVESGVKGCAEVGDHLAGAASLVEQPG